MVVNKYSLKYKLAKGWIHSNDPIGTIFTVINEQKGRKYYSLRMGCNNPKCMFRETPIVIYPEEIDVYFTAVKTLTIKESIFEG